MMEKLRNILLYAYISVLPWQTVYFLREVFIDGEKWQYGTIGVYVSDIVLICFVLLCGYLQRQQILHFFVHHRWRSSPAFILSAACVLYILVSLFWSGDPVLTFFIAIKIVMAMLLVVCMRVVPFSYKIVIAVLTVSMLGHAFLGLWQFLHQGDFSSTLLGLSQHDVWRGGVSVIETSSGRWLRAYGGLPHPNIFGVVMGVMSILSLGGVYLHREKRSIRALYLSTSIIFFAALLVSFSRTGVISFVCGLLLLFILFSKKSTERVVYWRIVSRLVFSYTLVFLVFLWAFGDLISTRAHGQARLEQLSVTERTSQVGEALHVIGAHPLIGVGAGTYTQYVREQVTDGLPVWVYQPVHNVDLLVFAELGFIGFMLLALLLIMLLRLYLSSGPHSQFRLFLLVSFIVMVVSTVFDHWQWDSHFGLFFFVVLLGFLLRRRL